MFSVSLPQLKNCAKNNMQLFLADSTSWYFPMILVCYRCTEIFTLIMYAFAYSWLRRSSDLKNSYTNNKKSYYNKCRHKPQH
mmetsp:Transcript_14228/g.28386  ORF Transcript_14228/g.28386 Transcript_14228/m.28386 type:complete len:82 (+) Transcript_14228:60-305(+)